MFFLNVPACRYVGGVLFFWGPALVFAAHLAKVRSQVCKAFRLGTIPKARLGRHAGGALGKAFLDPSATAQCVRVNPREIRETARRGMAQGLL